MDRICPFLALTADHRTAIDGYDSDHACHALTPAERLDRARQVEQCLSEAHRQCDRYLAFLAAHAADAPDIPTPSPDALIPRTRLIVEPEPRRMPGMGGDAPLGLSPQRWLVAGGVALVGVAAAATALGGGFGGDRSGPGPSVQPSPSSQEAVASTPTALESTEASPVGTAPASTEPTPRATKSAPGPTATPEPTTYVVQEGDTLNGIAAQFGTTAEAIRQANGLPGDVINIGQVLIIP